MYSKQLIIIIFIKSFVLASSGILNVGFDIDDTILFSRDVFLNIPENKRNPIDYGWINRQDRNLSLFITPTLDLINFFRNNAHKIYFITARSGEKGDYLAKFLSDSLKMSIVKDKNLFFLSKRNYKWKKVYYKTSPNEKVKARFILW